MTEIIYYFNIFSSLMIGLLVLMIQSKPLVKGSLYINAKFFLALASILMALGNATILISKSSRMLVEVFSAPLLIVSQLQAALFTFLVLVLLNSHYVNRRNILKHLAPTIVFILLYIGLLFIYSEHNYYSISDQLNHSSHPIVLLRTIYGVVYLVQIVLFIRLFHRERAIYIVKIENLFSDTDPYNLRWTTQLFYQATAIGLTVFVFSIYPNHIFDLLLTLFIPFFYLLFSVRYINYHHRLLSLVPAIEKIGDCTPPCTDVEILDIDMRVDQSLLFLKQGVTVSDYAAEFGLTERKFSCYINTTFGCRFNQWVNTKRIKYVKQLIQNNPELSIEILADQVGFANKSHLSRTFKEVANCSFLDYRASQTKGK